ncbi:MAG: type II toxin-antitoxin system VapC family toxin [Candidatus Dormibacteraceae bacterium]
MTEVPTYVLDASVALKWLLPLADEDHVPFARAIFADFRDGKIGLAAPDLIHAEVGHGLLRAVRRGRISREHASQAQRLFFSWNVPTVTYLAYVPRFWGRYQPYGCSFYDGMYLGLAEQLNAPLIHADEALRNTLANRFGLQLWIEDYPG